MFSSHESKAAVNILGATEIENALESYAKTKKFLESDSLRIEWLKYFYKWFSKDKIFNTSQLCALVRILNWKPEDNKPALQKIAHAFKLLQDKFDAKIWVELCDLDADFKKYENRVMFPGDFQAIVANPTFASELVKGLKVLNALYSRLRLEDSGAMRQLLYQNPANANQTALGVQLLSQYFPEATIIEFAKKYPQEFYDIAVKIKDIRESMQNCFKTTDDLKSFVNKLHAEVSPVVKSFERKQESEPVKVSGLSVFAVTEAKVDRSVELKKVSEVELPEVFRRI